MIPYTTSFIHLLSELLQGLSQLRPVHTTTAVCALSVHSSSEWDRSQTYWHPAGSGGAVIRSPVQLEIWFKGHIIYFSLWSNHPIMFQVSLTHFHLSGSFLLFSSVTFFDCTHWAVEHGHIDVSLTWMLSCTDWHRLLWLSGCVSIQGLHPLEVPAFVVLEGESFRETLFSGCVTRCFTFTLRFLLPRPAKLTIYTSWRRHFLSFSLLFWARK